jgi:SNF2 family DNA or RNA helicase
MLDYDWPIQPGRKPLEHQKRMASFMTLHPRCFNLSDMGTMKTLATLWAWDYLMLKGEVGSVIIYSTLSTMSDVWEKEIMKNFLSRRKAVVVHGDRKRRAERLAEKADFYIINHDGCTIGAKEGIVHGHKRLIPGPLAEYLRANSHINGCTVDEGGEFKNSATDKYKSLSYALRDKKYFNWLTGTPTSQSPLDAYAQAKMVRLDYNESYTGFRERTMQKLTTFTWKPKLDGYKIAASVLVPAIRYEMKDCMELPECVVVDKTVELTPSQVKAIKELKKSLSTMLDSGGKISAINEASLRLKLLQISQGAVYGDKHAIHKIDCEPRLNALKEVVREAGHKVLVFASLTSVVDLIYSELKKEYTVERVTGDVSANRRTEIFRDFQESEDPRIIVADPGCMAHGLTLTNASVTVWYGPTDKPGTYQQANKRMDRPGQKNKMLIVRIAATGTEREIYRRLDERGDMQGLMLNLIREGI